MLRKSILVLISCTKNVRFCPPLPISITVSIFTVSAFIFFVLTPNIPILTVIPQHTIIISPIHCIGYTALHKTFHNLFWCHDKEREKERFTLGFMILPAEVTSHSLYCCFRWCLNSLFATTFSTCRCEVIPSGMTTRLYLWNYQ